MRPIDADALGARMYHDAFETDSDMQKWDNGCWIRYKMFEIALEDAPTIEQSEIIRCKDCKHYYFAENRVPEEQSWVCDAWNVNQTVHMGYCFKAERKTDE